MKTCGLLIPAFATRRSGDLGIGDTLAMRAWINWAADHHVGFLQLLPINENGTDESPYSGISSIALDPIYLAFEPEEIPCLAREEIDAARNSLGPVIKSNLVDYPAVRCAKSKLLEISYARFTAAPSSADAKEFSDFQKTHCTWLPDYCLFKILIEINGKDTTWDQWPMETSCPDSARKHVAALRKNQPSHIDSRLAFLPTSSG